MARWARQGEPEEVLLANVLERALLLAGVAPGLRLALAGHVGAGLVQAVCARLDESQWTFVPGHHLLLDVRKRKTDAEVAEVRRVARRDGRGDAGGGGAARRGDDDEGRAVAGGRAAARRRGCGASWR